MRSRRPSATIAKLLPFLPAVAAFVVVASIPHPATILFALIGDAIAIVAMADALGIRSSSSPVEFAKRPRPGMARIDVRVHASRRRGRRLSVALGAARPFARRHARTVDADRHRAARRMEVVAGVRTCLHATPRVALSKILEEAQRLSSDNELYFSHGLASVSVC